MICTETEIETWIKELFADYLQMPVAKVSNSASFDRLGIDSTSAVGLVLRIERRLGARLPDTLLFDHPSIAELTKYLAQCLSNEREPSNFDND